VAPHLAEEVLFLPAWPGEPCRRHAPVGAPEFHFAAAVLTALAHGRAIRFFGACQGSRRYRLNKEFTTKF
jgi:hypothetical protein